MHTPLRVVRIAFYNVGIERVFVLADLDDPPELFADIVGKPLKVSRHLFAFIHFTKKP